MKDLREFVSEECYNDIMERVCCILEGSYIDKDGQIQNTLNLGVANGLDGRNIQQENKEKAAQIQAQREAKKNKPKNPNRVAGGKKAHATRTANKTKEFYSRPLFQAMGVTQPDTDKQN